MMNTAELILSVQAQTMKRSMEALDKLRIEAVQARRSSCLSAVFSQSQGGQTAHFQLNQIVNLEVTTYC